MNLERISWPEIEVGDLLSFKGNYYLIIAKDGDIFSLFNIQSMKTTNHHRGQIAQMDYSILLMHGGQEFVYIEMDRNFLMFWSRENLEVLENLKQTLSEEITSFSTIPLGNLTDEQVLEYWMVISDARNFSEIYETYHKIFHNKFAGQIVGAHRKGIRPFASKGYFTPEFCP